MTPEQQRTAIAEACGWKCNGHADQLAATVGWEFAYQFVIAPDGKLVTHNSIPDYLNDFNAMHDAKQVLWEMDWSFRTIFNDHLANIIKRRKVNRNEWDAETLLDATAAQFAEAFLRTIGEWKDCK
jgi:hypothetical protein